MTMLEECATDLDDYEPCAQQPEPETTPVSLGSGHIAMQAAMPEDNGSRNFWQVVDGL
jgi:hypothetical protein